jgi:hypothetical protein
MLRLKILPACVLVLGAALLAACATNARTSLDTSWVDPKLHGTKFKKVLILSVGHDEFAQGYFQEQMAAALSQRGMNAVASERFFTHRSPAEEARFKRAVESSGADAVLLARVVGVDEKSGMTPGTLIGANGVPYADAIGIYGAFVQTFAPTHYLPPSDWSQTTVTVETLLYEMKDRKAIWSARTQTKNAEKGDLQPAVAQFVGVLISAMQRDGVL